MFQGVINAVVVFAGGDFFGGGETNVAIMPSFVETGGAVGIYVDWFAHGAAGPVFNETVDETIFIGIFVKPLPFWVLTV